MTWYFIKSKKTTTKNNQYIYAYLFVPLCWWACLCLIFPQEHVFKYCHKHHRLMKRHVYGCKIKVRKLNLASSWYNIITFIIIFIIIIVIIIIIIVTTIPSLTQLSRKLLCLMGLRYYPGTCLQVWQQTLLWILWTVDWTVDYFTTWIHEF